MRVLENLLKICSVIEKLSNPQFETALERQIDCVDIMNMNIRNGNGILR